MLLDRVDNILFQKKCDIVKMWAVKAKLIFFLLPRKSFVFLIQNMQPSMNLMTAEVMQ